MDGERAAVAQQQRLRPRHGSQSPPLPSAMLMSVHNCVLIVSQTHNWAPLSAAKTDICQFICTRAYKGEGGPPPNTLLPSHTTQEHQPGARRRVATSPPRWKRCHMWLPLFIKLTPARLRCRPFPAFGPAHYSQYLHAILNCWEFPWWREPPLHEIFRARGDSREAGAEFLLRFDYTTWFFHELWQSCWIRVSSESVW